MKALVLRIWRGLMHDKRTMALMFLAPPVIIALLYVLLGTGNYEPKIALSSMPPQVVGQLDGKVEAIPATDRQEREQLLRDGKYDAVIYLDGRDIHIAVLENNSKSGKAIRAVQQAMSAAMPVQVFTEAVYGSADDNFFDSMAYVFLALIVFLFTFVVSGMAVVGERTAHTFERMLMTPVRRWQLIGGYIVGYGTPAVIQSLLILATGLWLLKVPCAGSMWLCLLVMVLLALVAVALGTTVSIFSTSEFQVAQCIPLLILPQVFFTGIIPLELIPYGLSNLCYLMPIYYAAMPLKAIMVQGAVMADIWPWLLAEVAVLAIFFAVNTASLRRYRRL